MDEDSEYEAKEIPLLSIVSAMSQEARRQVTAHGTLLWKNNQGVLFLTYEEACWQAFAEYILDIYGESHEVSQH